MCRKSKEDVLKWFRREGIIGDFQDYDCPSCGRSGNMRLTKDSSYSKDMTIWKCSNRKCNKNVSVRKGSWLEGSKMTIEQVLLFTFMWVWQYEQQTIMRECRIGSPNTCRLV